MADNSSIDSFKFITGRGMILASSTPETANTELFEIKGSGDSSLPTGLVSDKKQLILLDDVRIQYKDASSPKDAINDKHAYYVFGKTFSTLEIRGTIYLGCIENQSDGAAIKDITEWFNSNRVSKELNKIQISILGKQTLQAFLTDLTFGQTDPKLNAVRFVITGHILPS